MQYGAFLQHKDSGTLDSEDARKYLTHLAVDQEPIHQTHDKPRRCRPAALSRRSQLDPTETELTAKNAKSTKKLSGSVSASSALSAIKNPGIIMGEHLLQRILAERRLGAAGLQQEAPTL